MWAEFDSNGIRAENKYRGKELLVTGQFTMADRVFGNLTVWLKQDPSWTSDVIITCLPSEAQNIGKLERGQTVTIQARYDSFSMSQVYLDHGRIVPSKFSDAGPSKALASITVPSRQASFSKAVTQFIEPYRLGNAFKKSSLREKRKRAIQDALDNTLIFDGWLAKITHLSTTSMGDFGVLGVVLVDSDISVATSPGYISDIQGTLIDPTSSLYASLADLEIGSVVKVSGAFLADERDYIYEISMTEKGSLTEPEFLAKFSKVTLHKQ